MKEKEILRKLKEKTVFNLLDMQRILGSSKQYAKIALNRLLKRGEIKRIKKNSYTMYDDVFVVSTNIIYPGYLSFWSASSYKGYTEQILKDVQVACSKKIKDISFENYRIEFIKVNSVFGYEKIKTNLGEMFVAIDEKLIIDSLEHQEKMGNFDEIEKLIRNSKIDKEKMVDFLARNKNSSTVKRAGYLLEKLKKIDLSKEFSLDKNYVVLNKFSKKSKETNSKWRVKI